MIPQERLEQFQQDHPCKITSTPELTVVYLPAGKVDVTPIINLLTEFGITCDISWVGAGSPTSPYYTGNPFATQVTMEATAKLQKYFCN